MSDVSDSRDPAGGSWTGRRGRLYRPLDDEPPREGTTCTVRAAQAEGAPIGRSTVEEGARVAVRLLRRTDPVVVKAFQDESRVLAALTRAMPTPPCPTLYDRVGTEEQPGLVLEWCATDLELWWATQRPDGDAFARLCATVGELCRSIADHNAALSDQADLAGLAPVIKPRKVLRTASGRWVLARYGAPSLPEPPAGGGSATVLMTDAENFVSPESLFDCRVRLPMAQQTWAVGCSLFALLRMRTFLLAGAPLPSTGTDSHHFRSHRVNLVADLHARKPTLFRGRELDARQFLYPERLPDQDRRAIGEALAGVFGGPQDALEGQLAREVLKVLDRALAIDPAKRYIEPLELAADLEQLGARFREMRAGLLAPTERPPLDAAETQVLETQADGRRVPAGDVDRADAETIVRPLNPPKPRLLPDPPSEEVASAAEPAPAAPVPAEARPETAQPTPAQPRSAPPAEAPVNHHEQTRPLPRQPAEQQEGIAALQTRLARLEGELAQARKRPAPQARTAWWVLVAIFALFLLQIVELSVLGYLFWSNGVPADEPVAAAAVVEPPPPPREEPAPPPVEAEPADGEADEVTWQPLDEPAEAGPEETSAREGTTPAKRAPRSTQVPASTSAETARDDGADLEGIVRFIGGSGYLVGKDGRVEAGMVPSGTYELFARPDGGELQSLGNFAVPVGGTVVVRCGFGTCRIQ